MWSSASGQAASLNGYRGLVSLVALLLIVSFVSVPLYHHSSQRVHDGHLRFRELDTEQTALNETAPAKFKVARPFGVIPTTAATSDDGTRVTKGLSKATSPMEAAVPSGLSRTEDDTTSASTAVTKTTFKAPAQTRKTTSIDSPRPSEKALDANPPMGQVILDTMRVALVVASATSENTSWFYDLPSQWEKNIYVTDDPTAPLTVPMNKGREAMVYLTYIIDNYDNLPSIVLFQHANRYQWHNDDPLLDGKRVLERIQLPYVLSEGYVNLRCTQKIGCPSHLRPHEDAVFEAQMPMYKANVWNSMPSWYFKRAWEEIFPGVEVPIEVGASCCAQFAASAERIRQREKHEYERMRTWILQTELGEKMTGMVLEYMWHILMGAPAVHCPSAPQCYCAVFGLCDLQCDSDEECRGVYRFRRFGDVPAGWPDYDYNGNWQNATALADPF